MSLFSFGSSSKGSESSKVKWQQLTNIQQLEDLTSESNEHPVFIFKHSTRCSISRMALKQFERNYGTDKTATPYFLDLLEYRDISNKISEKFHVLHQSPQLLLLKNGQVVYHASHSDIDAEDLMKEI